MRLFNYLFWPLLMTVLIEEVVLLACKEKKLKVHWLAIGMNCCTNILLNWIGYSLHFDSIMIYILYVVIAEAIIWFIEGVGYFLVLKHRKQAIQYTLLCNGSSLLLGSLIQGLWKILEVKKMIFLDMVNEPALINPYVSIGIVLGLIILVLLICGVYYLIKYMKRNKK